MNSDPTFNRRKYPRVRTDSIVCIAPLEDFEKMAVAVDLSMTGIRFQAVGLEIDLGQTLRVTLNFGAESRSIVGRAVRITDLDAITQEVALAFLEMDDDTLQLFQDALPDLQEFEPL